MGNRKKQKFIDDCLKLYGEDGLLVDRVSIPWTENKIKKFYDLLKKDKFTEKWFNGWLDKEMA